MLKVYCCLPEYFNNVMDPGSPDKILPDKGNPVVPISYALATLQNRKVKMTTSILCGCDEISNGGHEIREPM